MSIIIAILIFSFIVIFHELGHFLVAKACDVKVNEFCLGLGPRILHFTKGETTYALRLLPFGGACMMEGEDEESHDGRAFNNKNVWQRIAIVFAGPFFNFILAFILSFIMISCVGVIKPVVAGVMEGYSAAEQGMQAGDEIVQINGYKVHFYQEISVLSFIHSGEDLDVTFLRDGQTHSVVIEPKLNEESGRYLLGIQGSGAPEKTNFIETFKYSVYEIKYQIYTVFASLKMLFTGKLTPADMSGPVGIVKVIDDTYEVSAVDGAFYIAMNMLNIAIMLSANLGVMNLLPLPALDGGRLLFFIIEVFRRRKMKDEIEGAIHTIGFMLLMALMVFVMINDIIKLF